MKKSTKKKLYDVRFPFLKADKKLKQKKIQIFILQKHVHPLSLLHYHKAKTVWPVLQAPRPSDPLFRLSVLQAHCLGALFFRLLVVV